MKHLLYTNSVKQKSDVTYEHIAGGTHIASSTDLPYAESSARYIYVPLNGDEVNEFSTFGQEASGLESTTSADFNPQYVCAEDHTQKFGSDTVAIIDGFLSVDVYVYQYVIGVTGRTVYFSLVAEDANGNTIASPEKAIARDTMQQWLHVETKLSGELTATNSIRFYIKVRAGNGHSVFAFKIKRGTYFRMKMYDNLTEDVVNADMLLVHDALNVVAKGISDNGLSVKSDWFRTPESTWNAGATGDGACKALTNGYHIRGLFTEGDLKRNMPLSFKALIEALDAMDCIGWGFSTENDELFVRVERWDWFYKDTTILTLTNVAEVTTDVYVDLIPTELKIGYKKYATQDQYNSIDSPHGVRTFVSGIKALSKALTKECEFVADNYAIEETRRARKDVNETEETTYDESIFVFELMRQYQAALAVGQTPDPPSYSIVHSALNATNVGRASEFINAKLTPRHMAARWRSFLFSANNTTPFRFTAGEINYKSSFKTTPEDNALQVITGNTYLKSFAVTAPQAENSDITYSHAKFKAEKITFQCPLSIAQYKTVKANPYGLVSVNGVLGWIMDFKYSFYDGLADFTLIAKYITQS